jgi:hypothetical protein
MPMCVSGLFIISSNHHLYVFSFRVTPHYPILSTLAGFTYYLIFPTCFPNSAATYFIITGLHYAFILHTLTYLYLCSADLSE